MKKIQACCRKNMLRWIVLVTAMCCLTLPSVVYAETWLAGEMTEAGPHPRLVFLPSQVQTVIERVKRAAYLPMMKDIVRYSSRDYELDNHEKGNEANKAKAAKARAFLYAIGLTLDASENVVALDADTRNALADQALTYLLNLYPLSRAKGVQPNDDIHTAEELMMYVQAYDLLKGGDYDFNGKEADVVQLLADLTADFYADFEISNWFACRAYVNNHRSKSASAIGSAAIALNGHDFSKIIDDGRYDIQNWAEFGMRNVDFSYMDTQMDGEGGYQESGSYLVYSGVNVYPFLRAWNQYTGAATWTVSPRPQDAPPYYRFDQQEDYVIQDFYSNPLFRTHLDWMWKIIQPDFTHPAVDDCTPGARLAFGFFINDEFENAGLYRWIWEHQKGGAQLGGLLNSCEMIAAFDDSIPAEPPSYEISLDQMLPVAGSAVFRSSWEEDAVYLHVGVEHGIASGRIRTRWGDQVDGGAGHEHADPGSFILFANGEPLTIDAGYLGWPNHEKVNNPENHNIILVDGKGPANSKVALPAFTFDDEGQMIITTPEVEGGWSASQDGEAWLVRRKIREENLGQLGFVEVWTEYHQIAPSVEIRRRILILDDTAVAVYDEITPLDDKAHELTFQLHGHGGGSLTTGSFELQANGGLWIRERAALQAMIVSDSDLTLEARDATHDSLDVFSWKEETHTVLDAKIQVAAGKRGRFLAVMKILSVDAGIPESTDFHVLQNGERPSGVAFGNVQAEWTLALGDAEESYTLNELNIQADMIAVKMAKDDSLPVVLFGIETSALGPAVGNWIDGSDGPVSFWLEKHAEQGYVGERMPSSFSSDPQSRFGLKLPEMKEVIGAFYQLESNGFLAIDTEVDSRFRVTESNAGLRDWAAVRIAMATEDEADKQHPAFRADLPDVLTVYDTVTLYNRMMLHDASPECSTQWRLLQQPEMSDLDLLTSEIPVADSVSLRPEIPGEYVVELTVDCQGLSGSDRRTITAIGEPIDVRAAMVEDGDLDEEAEPEEEVDEQESDKEPSASVDGDDEILSETERDGGGGGCQDASLPSFGLTFVLLLLASFCIRKKRMEL